MKILIADIETSVSVLGHKQDNHYNFKLFRINSLLAEMSSRMFNGTSGRTKLRDFSTINP